MKRFPLLPLTLLVLVFACSKQGEGERCNLANSDGDCEDGLRCVGAKSNNGCNTNDPNNDLNCLPYLCCPPAPQRSVVVACNQYQYGNVTSTGGSGSLDAGDQAETGGTEAAGGTEATGGTTSAGTENPTGDAGG